MGSTVGIIPSRYLSTRFPGKPLVDIGGKSMIWRVYEQCLKVEGLQKVYVATDDERIYNEIIQNGGLAIMTDSNIANGTIRCFSAYCIIREIHGDFDYLINIQGDEPFINPIQITQLIALIKTTSCPIATLVKKITDSQELWDKNVVKVITDCQHQAIYFSRQPVPFIMGLEKGKWLQSFAFLKHIGIYAFKTSLINKIKDMELTAIEPMENLEQLRWLEHGMKIATDITNHQTIAIDTPADLEKAMVYIQSIR